MNTKAGRACWRPCGFLGGEVDYGEHLDLIKAVPPVVIMPMGELGMLGVKVTLQEGHMDISIKIRPYTEKERALLENPQAYQKARARAKQDKRLLWAEGQVIHTQDDADRLIEKYGMPSPQQAWDALPPVITCRINLVLTGETEVCRNFLNWD